jgi:hypothetical protein
MPDQKSTHASCQLEAHRAHPNDAGGSNRSLILNACMRTQGYEIATAVDKRYTDRSLYID